jgi:YebC/PmpR family DNA-binding regulatory protein
MSGHSKWSTIKHKKGVADAKRGAEFSKLSRLIEVAARSGTDPEMNFRLKLAITRARTANMPAANIDKAIRKGAGLDKDKSQIEEAVYEGMGPGGVAIVVWALTDNRNRTVSELRNLFAKSGGSLGNAGSVAWQFQNRGVLIVRPGGSDLELKFIDAGADDFADLGDVYEVYTDPRQLAQVKRALVAEQVEVVEDRLALVPTTTVAITDPATARKVLHLIEDIDEHQDVSEVFANFDISEELLNSLTE